MHSEIQISLLAELMSMYCINVNHLVLAMDYRYVRCSHLEKLGGGYTDLYIIFVASYES